MDWGLLTYILVTILFVACVLAVLYFVIARGPKKVRP